MKRRQRRQLPQGIIIKSGVDRGDLILKEPDKYFEEARLRARERVRRDLERERLTTA